MEEFNILYHALEENGSIAYTIEKIEEHNKICYEQCNKMPDCLSRDYLLAMPSYLHRVLMGELPVDTTPPPPPPEEPPK